MDKKTLSFEAERYRTKLAQEISALKSDMIGQIDIITRDLERTRKRLAEGVGDPNDICGVNIFGEVQSVSRLDSMVGQLSSMVDSYRNCSFLDAILRD